MDRYSLIIVTEETAPVRRFDVRKQVVRRALWAAAIGAVVFLVGTVDYVRVRIAHAGLNALQAETAEQRATIEAFDERLDEVRSQLARVQDFERKVRIIANLPGSVASGGETVTEVGTQAEGDLGAGNSGVESIGPIHEGPPEPSAIATPPRTHRPDSGARDPERMSWLYDELDVLDGLAGSRGGSLEDLIVELENKHRKLASSPAIWPTKGWLTSRFGPRISPFTGRRQFHSGIDIAGQKGTDVFAPARGMVKFAGKRGPLGYTVILDHGYGVRTHYGHSSKLHVKRGQEVERGQVIASMGNTGRSTGPHLHYSVEVNGKSVNPLDYIFD
jgi:murein DD-endopeptidase MepM/ murein hydrolase activator NlpD